MSIIPTHFLTGGGLRVDYLITPEGTAQIRQPGGNSVYSAVGAALWTKPVAIWTRKGNNYPVEWLRELPPHGLDVSTIVNLPFPLEHRTFFAYPPDGPRIDTDPATHFARVGVALPPELVDYQRSTPEQDEPDEFDPIALRPSDWPLTYDPAETAMHLAPHTLATHQSMTRFLHTTGIAYLTLDPGERYMIPEREDFIRDMLPYVDAFMPSDMEVKTLFGEEVNMAQAAETLCEWGAKLVVIKNGANGVLLRWQDGRDHHIPAYHPFNDPRVVDVTGAGDSFCGGFMVGLALHDDPIFAAQMGIVSASLVIEGYGATYALRRGSAEAQSRLREILDRT